MRNTLILTLVLTLLFSVCLFNNSSYAGFPERKDFETPDTDTVNNLLVYFFDLRDRETFIQLTYTGLDLINQFDETMDITVHVQIFNVAANCNENNFFDVYTPTDTHVYNMRDIQKNDGTPADVTLPDNSYGFVFAFGVDGGGNISTSRETFIGNFRILDENGYEYRTNAGTEEYDDNLFNNDADERGYFNFNQEEGVILSDIIGIVYDDPTDEPEVDVDPFENLAVVNVDIIDLNENVLSCRNVVFACVSPDSPTIPAILEFAQDLVAPPFSGPVNVVAPEYGLNDAIPHSKGGELLCPGNTTTDGFFQLQVTNCENDDDDDGCPEDDFPNTVDEMVIFIGLNNGNERGSMDSFWTSTNLFDPFPPEIPN